VITRYDPCNSNRYEFLSPTLTRATASAPSWSQNDSTEYSAVESDIDLFVSQLLTLTKSLQNSSTPDFYVKFVVDVDATTKSVIGPVDDAATDKGLFTIVWPVGSGQCNISARLSDPCPSGWVSPNGRTPSCMACPQNHSVSFVYRL
jgi:hypothetical protein